MERFGHLINAFKFGAPPHGGLAYGLDRLCMLMAGADSIRDVIAFPKVQNASEPMTNCPDFVDDKQLDELSLAVTPERGDLRGGVTFPSRPRRGPIADGAARMRRTSVLPARAKPWRRANSFRPSILIPTVPTKCPHFVGGRQAAGRAELGCYPERGDLRGGVTFPSRPRRGPIADGAARMRRTSVLPARAKPWRRANSFRPRHFDSYGSPQNARILWAGRQAAG